MTAGSSTFRVKVLVPREVHFESVRGPMNLDRDSFYSWMWETFSNHGLLGVHEGTLLSERAAELGFETESWTIDSGEAPRERDWVSNQDLAETELYFYSTEGAEAAREILAKIPGLSIGVVEEQKPQDWDAEWKASFTGAQVQPFWSVIPPWVRPDEEAGARGHAGGSAPEVILRVNPGAGFGTGTHETTQLCLEAMGDLALALAKAGTSGGKAGVGSAKADRSAGTADAGIANTTGAPIAKIFAGKRVLDFGSGSGILAIGAALLGATVDAVEIDALAIDNATENARLNGVEESIRYSNAMSTSYSPYPIVLANILKPVLIEFAPMLVARLAKGGTLILSGLMEKDGADVADHYSELLDGAQPRMLAAGEWRALVWTG